MFKKFDLRREEREGGVEVVYVIGYLDSSTFVELDNCFKELIEEGKVKIIVDMSELEYISAAGLGVIAGMLVEVRNKMGDLKLCGMDSRIRNLFDILGFSRTLEIYSSQEEAMKEFKEEKGRISVLALS